MIAFDQFLAAWADLWLIGHGYPASCPGHWWEHRGRFQAWWRAREVTREAVALGPWL